MSIYSASKVIYGKSQPQKLYKYRDQMIKENSIRKLKSHKNIWQSTPKPLMDEIIEILKRKDIILEDFDIKILTKILNSKLFRTFVIGYNPDLTGEFDAIGSLLEILDLHLLQIYNYRKLHAQDYIKKVKYKHPPYPITIEEAKKFVDYFEKELNTKEYRNSVSNSVNAYLKLYGKKSKIFKNYKRIFNSVIDTLTLKNTQDDFYVTFLHQDLLFKLLFNKEKTKPNTLSALGSVFQSTIITSISEEDFHPYLIRFARNPNKKFT
jgi:hypothetical protein